jgi:hypothetical protein
MTKKEQTIVNKFFFKIVRHPRRKLINARKFDKRAPLDRQSVVVRVQDIITEWRKLIKEIER